MFLHHQTSIYVLMFSVFLIVEAWKWKRKKGSEEDDEDNEDNEDDEEEKYDVDVFCRNRSRLIKLEKTDDFYIVDVFVNNSFLMQCKFCEERDNGLPKIWNRQKHIFTGNVTEIELSMDNNASTSKTFVTKRHSLIIRNVQESDVGLYFCKAPYVDRLEKSFNYLVDILSHLTEDLKGGNLSDWRNYCNHFFDPIKEKLKIGHYFLDNENSSIPMNLTVFTDWTEWSECDSCFRNEGIRCRKGRCRIKPICDHPEICFNHEHNPNKTFFSDKDNTEKPNDIKEEVADPVAVKKNVFQFSIALSCRSLLLKSLFPKVYNITKDIPDFVLSEKCIGVCKGRSRKKGPKFRRSVILAKGAHLTLICPDSTIDSIIKWEHNKVRLYPNEGIDYIPGSDEPRIYIDSFNTLYLFEVTDKEAGNFTCFVDGVRMQEVNIIVLTRSLFFTKEFRRHLGYLGFVFLLCFFAYLAGVMILCIKKRAENRKFGRKMSYKKSGEGTEKLLKTSKLEENPDSDSSAA